MIMKRAVLSILLISIYSVAAISQPSEEYRVAVRELLKVSGSEETFKTVIDQMLNIFQEQDNIPEDVMEVVKKEISKTSLEDLTDLLAPIYHKHFSLTDIHGVITFYKPPIGKKYAEKSPMITKESMAAGQEWGLKLGKSIEEKINELGY